MDDLDSILSGQSSAAPEAKEQVAQEAQVEGESQQQEQKPEATEQEEQSQGQKTVPHEALHAEKQKVKRYTEEVAEFRRANETLQRQVHELLQRIPVPQREEPKQAPDFFEDPAAATRHLVTPQFEQVTQAMLALAKDNAIVRFTEEKVDQAEQAFIQALQGKSLDPSDYHKVVNSPNRYAAAVQWHQRKLAQAEIGDDPVAFRAKVEAEFKEKYGIKDDSGGQPPLQRTLPSNLAGARNVGSRSGPAWSGPPALNDIFKR